MATFVDQKNHDGVVIFVTGEPGVGKSTLLKQVAGKLTANGAKVMGFVTEEVRGQAVAGGGRVGFDLVDLENCANTNERVSLARLRVIEDESLKKKNMENKKKVPQGRYLINVDSLEEFSLDRLDAYASASSGDIVIIDEIGKMQINSKLFLDKIKKLLDSKKKVLVSIASCLLGEFHLTSDSANLIHCTKGTRDTLVQNLFSKFVVPVSEKTEDVETRVCTKCKKSLPRTSFSRKQWSMGPKKGKRKCAACTLLLEKKTEANRKAKAKPLSKLASAVLDAAKEAETITGMKKTKGRRTYHNSKLRR